MATIIITIIVTITVTIIVTVLVVVFTGDPSRNCSSHIFFDITINRLFLIPLDMNRNKE